MTYDPFTVIAVPFSFTDSAKAKKRPAVVVSSRNYQTQTGHITLLMVTSARHTTWFGDYSIQDLKSAGLPTEFIVRQKIFTIDMRFIIKTTGILSDEDRRNVIGNFKKHIHLTGETVA
jgi:mRNA interferase MazF